MAFTNSPLVNYTKISPNKTANRKHAIDTITIHCVVGQCSVETIGNVFAPISRQASSNYGIGPDGRIGMYVEEKDRSWCSSNASNDNRAITIEVASDRTHPYAITDAAYKALVKLCADICKRNGIPELRWKADKSLIGQIDKQNMTVHRWFANKSCPGDYIYSRLGQIASEVNVILGTSKPASTPVVKPTTSVNKINVIHQVCTKKNGWLPEVKNYNTLNTNGYSGALGNPMVAFRAKATTGVLEYRAHAKGGRWFGWRKNYDIDSAGDSFAGDGKTPIDGLQFRIVGVQGKHVRYRVHAIKKGWLGWVTDYGNGSDGYAGWYGYAIDAVQIEIV